MQTIQELIDKALEPKPRERSGKFSPSSFGGCYRKQYWNRKDEPQSNPVDARTLRVFKCGNLFEDFVGNLLGECEKQVRVEEDDVLGFADFVRGNEVIDTKSQHSRSFWYLQKKEVDIRREKYHNWLQIMYYTGMLQKEFGRLVLISKDDLCIAEYVQPFDDYWANELDNELIVLRGHWLANTVPPAEPRLFYNKKTKTFKECDYCNWKDKCFEMEKKE